MSQSVMYLVESDNYSRTGTLNDFRECIYGEENYYWADQGLLFYGVNLIGRVI